MNTSSQNFEFHRSRTVPQFDDSSISDDDMNRINRLAPAELSSDQIYVRSMYLCSTQPCDSDGCQFSNNALYEIAHKIIGQSVLSGHDRSRLPLARFYKAMVVKIQNEQSEPIHVVRAWFYWLRDTSRAKDLLLNIDGGIYREVSLSWRFDRWRCSICNAENGQCAHQVGTSYEGKTCYRLIDHILDVLEGSLVYKAADSNSTLSGVRVSRDDEHDVSIIISTDSIDELFDQLHSLGVINDIQDMTDTEACQGCVDRLWCRSNSAGMDESFVKQWLSSRGVCLSESIDDQANDRCEVSIFVKNNTELTRMEYPSQEENI
jgi:hypothetical protein